MPKAPRGEKRPADMIGAVVTVPEIATSDLTEELAPGHPDLGCGILKLIENLADGPAHRVIHLGVQERLQARDVRANDERIVVGQSNPWDAIGARTVTADGGPNRPRKLPTVGAAATQVAGRQFDGRLTPDTLS
jgi:hypothetical protein